MPLSINQRHMLEAILESRYSSAFERECARERLKQNKRMSGWRAEGLQSVYDRIERRNTPRNRRRRASARDVEMIIDDFQNWSEQPVKMLAKRKKIEKILTPRKTIRFGMQTSKRNIDMGDAQ